MNLMFVYYLKTKKQRVGWYHPPPPPQKRQASGKGTHYFFKLWVHDPQWIHSYSHCWVLQRTDKLLSTSPYEEWFLLHNSMQYSSAQYTSEAMCMHYPHIYYSCGGQVSSLTEIKGTAFCGHFQNQTEHDKGSKHDSNWSIPFYHEFATKLLLGNLFLIFNLEIEHTL